MGVKRGKIHEHLGLIFDYNNKIEVIINMKQNMEDLVKNLTEIISKIVSILA